MVEMMTLTFDEQLARLVARRLPASPDMLASARVHPEPTRSAVAWSREAVPVAQAAALIERDGRGVVLGHLTPEDLERFVPIETVELPDAAAYTLVDVDLGADSRNVPPETALREILAAGRSPLTLDEGVALMLQQPDVIAPNWGFSLAGSRCGDQRVPALWISARKPKLGWCWDRNPHTWLGTASCASRAVGG
jgi:hypothetical protein